LRRARQTKPSKLAAKNFPDDDAVAAAKDWHRFVLVELNGIGTLLRYDAEEGGKRARRFPAFTEELARHGCSP
jgi:hypothetical protein